MWYILKIQSCFYTIFDPESRFTFLKYSKKVVKNKNYNLLITRYISNFLCPSRQHPKGHCLFRITYFCHYELLFNSLKPVKYPNPLNIKPKGDVNRINFVPVPNK